MKKLKIPLIVVGLVVIVFVILTYGSVRSSPNPSNTYEIVEGTSIENINFKTHDSVLIDAITLYDSNALKDLMQGKQYLEAWATPIKVPIVFLDTIG